MNAIDIIGCFSDKGEIELELVRKFESECGFALPVRYVDLICRHNALSPIKNIFDFFDYEGRRDERDLTFLGYGDLCYGRIDDFLIGEYRPKFILAFGVSAGGDYISFDYRNAVDGAEPSIVLMHHDRFLSNESGACELAVSAVSIDFDAFIRMLHD